MCGEDVKDLPIHIRVLSVVSRGYRHFVDVLHLRSTLFQECENWPLQWPGNINNSCRRTAKLASPLFSATVEWWEPLTATRRWSEMHSKRACLEREVRHAKRPRSARAKTVQVTDLEKGSEPWWNTQSVEPIEDGLELAELTDRIKTGQNEGSAVTCTAHKGVVLGDMIGLFSIFSQRSTLALALLPLEGGCECRKELKRVPTPRLPDWHAIGNLRSSPRPTRCAIVGA